PQSTTRDERSAGSARIHDSGAAQVTMATPLKALTPGQRRIVRNSFDSLRDMAVPVALLFYGKLFQMDPSARPLFHNDLSLQSQKLMDMLTSIVESLEDF